MKTLRKLFMWCIMLSKRLLRKYSFAILLFLIPLFVYCANHYMQSDSSVLKIAICSEDNSKIAEKVIQKLCKDESIIRFERFESKDSALRSVENYKNDALWQFDSGLAEKMDKFTSGESSRPFITVYMREETIPLKISLEKLFAAIYEDFSYLSFENFAYENIVSPDTPTELLRDYYNSIGRGGNIVEINTISANESKRKSLLTSPMRGILAMLVTLCSLAAAMYFIEDRRRGVYDFLRPRLRILPAFAQCFSASVMSGAAVIVALFVSDMNVNLLREFIAMLLFAFAMTGFCMILCLVFGTESRLGAFIPMIMVAMTVLSPVFVNLRVLPFVRHLVPAVYYLNSIYTAEYFMYILIYIAVVYTTAGIINILYSKKSE